MVKLRELLLSLARGVMRPEDRPWLDALLGEADSADGPRRRAAWLLGLVPIIAGSVLRRLASSRLIPAVFVLGALLVYLDLQGTNRMPYFLFLFASVATLTFLKPALPWRWPVILAFVLPLITLIGFEGPYHHDSGNTTFPIIPALAIALVISFLRRRWEALRA